jgi:LysR family transcriptional regulator, low CO2-responsive transcriptional regulator
VQAPLTLHQLTVFRAVARHLNYTRAADDLHLTQPAVSRQVQLLENTLGVQVFERVGRRIRLTDAGADVLSYAQRIGQLQDELEAVLSARNGLQRGSLRLIGTTTAGEYLLPPLVADFRRSHPGIQVALRVGNREEVLSALANGEVDLAVMGRPPARPDWDSIPILPNQLVAIASPRHPLVNERAISPTRLAGETIFLRETGSGTRLAAEEFWRLASLSLDDAVELGSDSAIKQVVMAGLGIAILSRQAIELEVSVRRLAVLAVQGLPLQRQWFLVCPAEKRGQPAGLAFRRLVERTVQVQKPTARASAKDRATRGAQQ